MKNLILLSAGLLVMAGCGPSPSAAPTTTADCKGAPDTAEITSLKQRVAQLEAENADLRQTAPMLAGEVKAQAGAGNLELATQSLATLKMRYPGTPELAGAEKEIAALSARQAAAKAEEERRRALGFKALGTRSVVDADEVKVAVSAVGLTGRWIFDDHGHQYSYMEAARGSKYLVAKVQVATKGDSNPSLPGMAAYVLEGDALQRVTVGQYRFARWMDYGSYLGNGHDFRNDFRHSSKIAFSVGLEIPDAELKKPVFLVAHTRGCFTRTEERFQHPPVAYREDCGTSLPLKLTMADFADGTLVVVKALGGAGK